MDEGFPQRLAQRMAELGLSHRKLAEQVGRDGATVFKWTIGETFPRRNILPLVARALQTSEDWLLNGVLNDKGVTIAGYVRAGGIAVDAQGEVAYVPVPPGAGSARNLLAYIVEDASNSPVYRGGDTVYVDLADCDPAKLIGEDCLVTLADGRRLFRMLQPGEATGTYTLHAHNAGDMRSMEIVSAARVAWVMRSRR